MTVARALTRFLRPILPISSYSPALVSPRPATFALFVAAGLLLCAASARTAQIFDDSTFYAGDPHAHTGISGDGGSEDLGDCRTNCGDFATVLDTARANGLDWVAMPDHVNGTPASSAEGYARLNALVTSGDDPADGFVTVPAAEVWFTLDSGATLGHKTLMMFGDDARLAALSLTDVQPHGNDTESVAACSDIWAWMDRLTAAFGPALLIPHHPALTVPMPTDWSCHSNAWEPSVEAYSGHGNSLTDAPTYDPPWSGTTVTGTVETALDPAGDALRMGFMAGTDSHDTRPGSVCDLDQMATQFAYGGGLTIAVIPADVSFDRTALYDAIVAHHTYITTGPIIPLDVQWFTGGVKLGGLGDTVGLPTGQPLSVRVRLPAEDEVFVKAVTLEGPNGTAQTLEEGGDGAWSAVMSAGDVPAYLYASVQLDGVLIYGSDGACVDGGADNDEYLWASPSWVEPAPADLDGDGVSWASGDCNDGDPTISPNATEIWYDGIDQNCDGNDTDQDGDGVAALGHGGLDCDDTNATVYPGAVEVWYDGVDQDCDGNDADQDRDGFDARAVGGPDCDDLDATVTPGSGAYDADCVPIVAGVVDGEPTPARAAGDSGCSTTAGPLGLAACVAGILLTARRRPRGPASSRG